MTARDQPPGLRPGFNDQILAEAAEWLVELTGEGVSDRTKQRFDEWLRSSPEHIRSYLDLLPIWAHGEKLVLDANCTPEYLIALARSHDNVIDLGHPRPVLTTQVQGPQRRLWRRALAAASVVAAVIAVSTLIWAQLLRYPTYVTEVAEQRSIELSDGSRIYLNAQSKVRIRYSKGERGVDLIRGQALFRVAKNSARPFIVSVNNTQVRAVGTEFDVNRVLTSTRVTVLEGHVAVSSAQPFAAIGLRAVSGSEQPPVLLSPGEQLTVDQSLKPLAARVDVAQVTAWTERRLVFEDSTMAEVAEEFNRYNRRLMVISDPALRNMHITATFTSTDPASLVRFLQAQPGVSVVETSREIQIIGH